MAISSCSRLPLLAWIGALALLAGCEDSSPTPEALCSRAAKCEQMDVLVSPEACSQQLASRFAEAGEECSKCALSLPCAGMARLATGKLTLGQLCASCPDSLGRASCPPGHEHVFLCGLAAQASASASASASAAPPAKAPKAAASASASAAGGSASGAASAPPPLSASPR